MNIIHDGNGKVYSQSTYQQEKSFEKYVADNAEYIFGKSSLYFDVKGNPIVATTPALKDRILAAFGMEI